MIEKIHVVLILLALTSCSSLDPNLSPERILAGSPVMGHIMWSCNEIEYEINISDIESSKCDTINQVSPEIAAQNAIEYAESNLDLGISGWMVESVTVYFRRNSSSYYLVTLVSPYDTVEDFTDTDYMEIGVSTCGNIVPPRKFKKPLIDPL